MKNIIILMGRIRKKVGLTRDWFRCQLNYWLFFRQLVKNKNGLHLGCGWNRIDSLVNTDLKPTKATDLLIDCRNLRKFYGSKFQVVCANAVLEHLTPNEAGSFINQCQKVLSPKGYLLITGIPDFENISQSYLNRDQLFCNKTLTIDMVMNYIYGWEGNAVGQTTESIKKNITGYHKSLIDSDQLSQWLSQADYQSWAIFRYCYQDEKLPLNLGLIAYNQKQIINATTVVNKVNQMFDNHIQLPIMIVDHS